MYKLNKSGIRCAKPAVTLFTVLLLLALRLPALNNSPFEYQAWRQSDTEAIARNFIEQKFHILYPQLNYDGPPPNYVQLELQVTTFIIAILYKLFGYHYYLARLVPLLFFTGSAWYLYLIAAKIFAAPTARLAVILYGIFPLNIFISRAIMPEAAALFFYTGAFYYFMKWKDGDDVIALPAAALFTALAVAVKVPAVFIGLPMLYMSWQKYGLRLFSSPKLWSFAAVSLGLPLLYYIWLHGIAETDYVTGIAVGQILPRLLEDGFTPEARSFLLTALPRSYTTWGLLLAAPGLFILRKQREIPLLVWALALLLQVAIIVSVIRLDYYLVFLSPLLALLGATVLHRLTRLRAAYVLVPLVFLTILYTGWSNTNIVYPAKENLLRHAEIIRKNTAPDDLIVTGTVEPLLLNCSNRQRLEGRFIRVFFHPGRIKLLYRSRGAVFLSFLRDTIPGR